MSDLQPAPDVIVSAPPLVLTDDTSQGALGRSLHLRHVVASGLTHARTTAWPTAVTDLDGWGESARFQSRDHAEREVWATSSGWSIHVGLGNGTVEVRAAAMDTETLDQCIADVLELCPRREHVPDEPRVPMTFWSLGPHGPVGRSRSIDVPRWGEIRTNYAPSLVPSLDQLVDNFVPGVGGQLILLHGPPGTGKTWLLRGLASEWRDWCDVHYVTDPEVFFGAKAGYMLDVLLHQEDLAPAITGADEPEPDERAADGRWRLLVCEDTGELLTADAKERSGQGLSRLLNVVDGLLGQGLRIMVLITTNERITDLHSAVRRPGRCAAQILFDKFTLAEAREWLSEHGGDHDAPDIPSGGATIAELYERLSDTTIRPAEPAGVGFGA